MQVGFSLDHVVVILRCSQIRQPIKALHKPVILGLAIGWFTLSQASGLVRHGCSLFPCPAAGEVPSFLPTYTQYRTPYLQLIPLLIA